MECIKTCLQNGESRSEKIKCKYLLLIIDEFEKKIINLRNRESI